MSRRPAPWTVFRRIWLPLVVVIALMLGALGMWKVHQASSPGPVLAVNPPQAPEEFTPKRLTYELTGDVGSGGILSYIDIDGHPHTVELSELPWSHTETTTLTVVSGCFYIFGSLEYLHGSTPSERTFLGESRCSRP